MAEPAPLTPPIEAERDPADRPGATPAAGARDGVRDGIGDGTRDTGPAFLAHLQSLQELQVTLSLEGSDTGILREGTTGTVEIVGADCVVALVDPFANGPEMRFGWSEGRPMAPHEMEVFMRRMEPALGPIRSARAERILLGPEAVPGTPPAHGSAAAPPPSPPDLAGSRDPSRAAAAFAETGLGSRPRRFGSVLAIGIGTGPARRGVLVLARHAEVPFSREQVVLAEILSTAMAIQIDRARRANDARRLSERLAQEVEVATRTLRDHNHELEAINAIATAASPSLDPEKQMDIALRKAMDSTSHRLGVLHFVQGSEGDETLVFARAVGDPEAAARLRALRCRRGEGLPGRVWAEGRTILVPDLTAARDLEETEALRQAGCQAAVCVPMRARGRTIGTLLLGSGTDRPYAEGESNILEAVADQVAVVIQNARLLADVMAYSLDLESQVQRLAQQVERARLEMQVYRPVLGGTTGGEVRELLEETLSHLLACLQAGGHAAGMIEAAGVHLVEPRSRTLQLRAQSGLPSQVLAGASTMPVSRTLIGRAFETGAAAGDPGAADALDSSGLRLVAAVPLRAAGAVHGALWIAAREAGPLPPDDLRVLEIAGRLLGLAVENRRAFQDVAPAALPDRDLPAQLMAAQKMESVGTLATGIAHEFNNILGAITGYASHIKALATTDNPIHRHALVIEEQALRAAGLTRQLLAFARGGQYTLEMVDLNALIEDTTAFLAHGVDPRIKVETHIDPDLPAIEADAGQMKQILLNVAVNAIDAMPQGGRLTFETRLARLDENHVHACPGMSAGDYVEVVADDTGEGIPPEIVDRVFEPFFTTKKEGQGTGLGLSVVYGIVRHHHGQVLVNSTPGLGTTVRIYLPAGRRLRPAGVASASAARMPVDPVDPPGAAAEPSGQAADPARPAAAPAGQTAAIDGPAAGSDARPGVLVVDDEPVLREMMQAVLEGAGYRVIVAADGVDALEQYRQAWGRIGLVLLDMMMPRMSGLETYRRLYGMDRTVRVLICSGNADHQQTQQALREGALGLFPKPFTTTELLARVRRHLPPPVDLAQSRS
jgi:signal transduction histidine kinase/ActR/RegA family two-component response regulator/putative methionine-R-sulfoxide reductase with GAF domain